MRARIIQACVAATAVSSLALTATACSSGSSHSSAKPQTLSNVKIGKTVFADMWDDCGKRGDQAEVELHPTGVWTVDRNASVRPYKDSAHQVKIKRTSSGYTVLNMGSTLTGTDSDRSIGHDELTVRMDAKPRSEVVLGGTRNTCGSMSHHGKRSTSPSASPSVSASVTKSDRKRLGNSVGKDDKKTTEPKKKAPTAKSTKSTR